jgi:hypothetical protein
MLLRQLAVAVAAVSSSIFAFRSRRRGTMKPVLGLACLCRREGGRLRRPPAEPALRV